MSSSLISLVLVGKKATANFVTITWRVPIGRRSSHQLLPYKMAQDEKKPRSRHCSVLLPLTGQRHHVSVWLGKCGVAHIPRGHHSFDSSCSNKQTFFSPQDESRTGPAAFLRGHLPCRTRQRLVRKRVSRSVARTGMSGETDTPLSVLRPTTRPLGLPSLRACWRAPPGGSLLDWSRRIERARPRVHLAAPARLRPAPRRRS